MPARYPPHTNHAHDHGVGADSIAVPSLDGCRIVDSDVVLSGGSCRQPGSRLRTASRSSSRAVIRRKSTGEGMRPTFLGRVSERCTPSTFQNNRPERPGPAPKLSAGSTIERNQGYQGSNQATFPAGFGCIGRDDRSSSKVEVGLNALLPLGQWSRCPKRAFREEPRRRNSFCNITSDFSTGGKDPAANPACQRAKVRSPSSRPDLSHLVSRGIPNPCKALASRCQTPCRFRQLCVSSEGTDRQRRHAAFHQAFFACRLSCRVLSRLLAPRTCVRG